MCAPETQIRRNQFVNVLSHAKSSEGIFVNLIQTLYQISLYKHLRGFFIHTLEPTKPAY